MAKKKALNHNSTTNFTIIVLTLMISLFGIAMVFSASYYQSLSKFGNPYYYFRNDVQWMFIGWIVLIGASYFDYKKYRPLSNLALAASFVLLLLIFTPMGVTINNATRWLNFYIITVMPGEVVKTVSILWTANFYAEDPERINKWKGGHFIMLGLMAAIFLLIYKQPNLSTAATVVIIMAGIMFIAGLSWKIIGLLMMLGGTVFLLAILAPGARYMLTRVQTAFNPWADPLGSGYQVVQSLLAFGSGGLLGVGPGQSTQKALYLPEPQNDFILAIIGEELGFVGVVLLLFAYVILVYELFKVAISAPDYFGMLFAGGVALHFGIQVLLNVAIVTASFFPTGVALPLITLGGNSTLLYLWEVGTVINISRQSKNIEEL